MIVKILRPSATFEGVSYNSNKIEKDKGELMKVENFGALQALEHLKPQDYINYLEARSKTSARIKYPQLHAVISCRGRSHSKEQLTELATEWLKGMGYGEQPYLLVFHKDTGNNHVHIVSTRIDENGKKINDSYEKIRAYQVLNQIMSLNEKEQVVIDLDKALTYHFSTRAQFMMLLECQGYALKLNGDRYQLFKYGKQQGEIETAKVDARIGLYQKNINRLAQLRAITERYRLSHDAAAIPVSEPQPKGKASKPTGYTSELAEVLSKLIGVQVLFHGQPGKPPYGYTLIDHTKKTVYKGKELMPIAEFIRPEEGRLTESELPAPEIIEPDITISPVPRSETVQQSDTGFPDTRDQFADVSGYGGETASTGWQPEINLDIADDIDDEAILGRNRQRKRKARTNTR
jgi:hypothetical protein